MRLFVFFLFIDDVSSAKNEILLCLLQTVQFRSCDFRALGDLFTFTEENALVVSLVHNAKTNSEIERDLGAWVPHLLEIVQSACFSSSLQHAA